MTVVFWLIGIGLAGAAGVGGVFLGAWLLRARREAQLRAAQKLFHLRREWLEAEFLKTAAASGKPRGLAWAGCEFEDAVAWAREKGTGHLRAFVAVTIRFEAIAGGGMEDNPNVGNKRAATAAFRYAGGKWTSDGRTIFNLNPAEAIAHYQSELETVDEG